MTPEQVKRRLHREMADAGIPESTIRRFLNGKINPPQA